MQQSTVACRSRITCTRWMVVMAPPGIAIAPSRCEPPNADQKPMKGPKEKAKKIRSSRVTPAGA